MLALWNTLRNAVPGPLRAALVLAIGFLGFIAWDQSYWWRTKPDYGFGWLVPVFVAFVVYERWPRVRDAIARCAAPDSPRANGAGKWLLRLAAAAMLLGGVAFFLLGSLYRAGAGSSQPGTLAITLGMVGILFPLLFVNAPDSPSPAPARLLADARLAVVAPFTFPILVWLISAPLVSFVEQQLSLALLHRVVATVSFVFDALGLPIEQQGNVLALPTGSVGVEEACSGIRSLTGCLFAGSFLAAVFLDRAWKKAALIGCALVLAFASNLARSLFLTAWAYHHGPAALGGAVHDLAGYGVLALTVVGLLCIIPLLNFRPAERVAPPVRVAASS